MSLNLHETVCGKDDPVTDYMKAKYSMTPDERRAAFRQLAKSFGQADAETLAYRQACRQAEPRWFSAVANAAARMRCGFYNRQKFAGSWRNSGIQAIHNLPENEDFSGVNQGGLMPWDEVNPSLSRWWPRLRAMNGSNTFFHLVADMWRKRNGCVSQSILTRLCLGGRRLG